MLTGALQSVSNSLSAACFFIGEGFPLFLVRDCDFRCCIRIAVLVKGSDGAFSSWRMWLRPVAGGVWWFGSVVVGFV